MTGATDDPDLAPMRAALGLARRGLGDVWPNPAVGCVLVRDGRVVGRGWTQPGGRPHAETEALRRAGDAARGATAYVTLEPCAHHGRTPPCADALIAAGISRCVAAIEDPDPRVAGRGLERLKAAGIAVTLGVGGAEAAEVNAGFLSRILRGRPLVTLKLATTLDGRIATRSGDSRWITGPEARAEVHRLRATHDAILVGIGTVLADDPDLTCRLPGLEHRSPLRIVLDSRGRLPSGSRLASSCWMLGCREAPPAGLPSTVEVIPIARGTDGRVDLVQALAELGRRGLTRVLVEGGGEVAAALLKAGLVDRLAWFHAPKLIGGDGLPALGTLGIEKLADARVLVGADIRRLGEDVLTTCLASNSSAERRKLGPDQEEALNRSMRRLREGWDLGGEAFDRTTLYDDR